MKKSINQVSFKEMIIGDEIFVPNYQRAYSWEVARENEQKKRQADLFLEDLLYHIGEENKKNAEKFYLGTFLYEKSEEKFAIIDGQQRLTTIIILLAVINKKLNSENIEKIINFEEIKFSTVEYDNEEFQRYIFLNEIEEFKNLKEFREKKIISSTESIRRVIETYLYFKDRLKEKNSEDLKRIAETIAEAQCTINIINSKVEATQIFIFENNRGKSPTNLELTKTKLMYFIYNNFENSNKLLEEVDKIFGNIYKKITKLENYINEDTVLAIAMRMYKQNLRIDGILTEIDNMLTKLKSQKSSDDNTIESKEEKIKNFLKILEYTYDKVDEFISKGLAKSKELDFNDEYEYVAHSLINLGISVQLYPIVLKSLELEEKERVEVLKALEKIILRNLVVKTRANLAQRFYWIFEKSCNKEKDLKEIITIINEMIFDINLTIINKKDLWWFSYWNQETFNKELDNGLTNLHATRYLLWKYENYLRKEKNMRALKYTEIKNYQVEHISPQTENTEENNGYDKLEWNILNSYGNLMLLTQKTNVEIQNKNLREKLKAYKKEREENEIKLLQQINVIDLIESGNSEEISWKKDKIEKRKDKILDYIKANF